jgi:hypothetical protein
MKLLLLYSIKFEPYIDIFVLYIANYIEYFDLGKDKLTGFKTKNLITVDFEFKRIW